MAIANKGALRITGISAQSFLLMGLVIILVVALFFIPEIIDFQKSLSNSDSQVASTKSTVTSEEPDQTIVIPPDSGPLGEITALLDGNYIEQLKAKRIIQTNLRGTAKVGPQQLAWDTIRNPGSADVLRNAEREAMAMVKELPEKFSATRFALFNFVNAVRMVLQNGEHSMTPEDAIQYVEFARIAVTRAMERENVERAIYNRWVSLSLGPVIDRARGFDLDNPKPFNPQLTLTWVSVYKPGNNYGRWVDHAPVYMSFRGYVVGRDVDRIEFYLNGNRVGKAIPTTPDQYGRRIFRYGQANGRGVYTLRVYDKFGQIYVKTYNFYPRVRALPWKRGSFAVPKVAPTDRRLDRFFTFRGGQVLGVSSPEFFSSTEMEQF